MTRVLVSGASGFIGQPLVSFLKSKGISVSSLSRTHGDVFWNPDEAKANPKDFEGFDAVIHLAGEPLSLSRWTAAKREKIFVSRVLGTELLIQTLSQVHHAPKVLITASAVGFYGDRGETLLTEEDSKGEGFLSNVCFAWERASQGLETKGVRVVNARFGLVLGPNGGALQKLSKIYNLRLGGKIGTGNQWMSWIHLTDLISGLFALFKNDSLKGPVNLVAPNPVRQKEFAEILGEILQRPHFLSTPAWLIRAVFGADAAGLLLSNTRVTPAKLLASNFAFQYIDLRSALFSCFSYN